MSKKGLNDLQLLYYNGRVNSTRGTVTIPTSDTISGGTASIEVEGELLQATMITPEMEGSDSTDMNLQDELGVDVFTFGTQAEKGTHTVAQGGTNIGSGGGTLDLNKIFLWGTTKVIMTAQGTQSANVDIAYNILTQR